MQYLDNTSTLYETFSAIASFSDLQFFIALSRRGLQQRNMNTGNVGKNITVETDNNAEMYSVKHS